MVQTVLGRDMHKLTFYHQKRRDEGLRTGVDFDDERVLERFEPGHLARDSALKWFVDIRCSGEVLPSEPEGIREWFLSRSGPIQTALRQLADDCVAGIDKDWPLKRQIPTSDGVSMAIYCSAMRRLSGREIASVIAELEAKWPVLVRELPSYTPPIPANA
jgi:hypothetical protein